MKTFILGQLCLTTTFQPTGAPLVDKCFVCEEPPGERRWRGIAILLKPWKRNPHGQAKMQRAFVVALERPGRISGRRALGFQGSDTGLASTLGG